MKPFTDKHFLRDPAWRMGLALLVGAAILFLLRVEGRFLYKEWLTALLWFLPAMLFMMVIPKKEKSTTFRNTAPLTILFVFLILYLFSSASLSKWFYFLHWVPSEPKILKSGVERFVWLTVLLIPLLYWKPKLAQKLVFLIPFVSVALCGWALWSGTHGVALWRDDHPSFVFRLWEFGKTFPRILNYNPFWNGGGADFVCTTSGTNAIGLLLWPLWRFAQTHSVYTFAVGIVFIVIVPLVAAGSLRIQGSGRTASAIAFVLAMGVSRRFFLWLLHFGTIGACLASSFVLPVSACLFRVVWLNKREKWLAFALILSTLFLILWPSGVIMLAPIAFSMALGMRRWTWKKILFLMGCGGVVLLLYARPLSLILFQNTSPQAFVLGKTDASTPVQTTAFFTVEFLKRGWSHFLSHLVEGNPLLLFLGIGGLFVLPYRSVRMWYWPIVVGFALLAGWGRDWKPDLQLDRMAIPLFFAAVAPTAVAISKLLRINDIRLLPVRAGLIALLAMTGYNLSAIYRAPDHMTSYVTMPAEARELADWIKTNTPPDGRILFAGRTVHALGGGHVAYLPVMANREMMACDYYHFPPKTVDYEYPPQPFRDSPAAVFEFLDLYNVSHVITYHDKWKGFFRAFTDHYEEVGNVSNLTIFRVRRDLSIFIKGHGKVFADFNRLDVNMDKPEEEAVIKYNWVKGLKAESPAEIFPYDAGSGIVLIGIKPHGKSSARIFF